MRISHAFVRAVTMFASRAALGWEVPDLRATLRALAERGVAPNRYPNLETDALGVWDAGPALVAWFQDPDGNTLSLTQHVSKA